MFEPQAFRDALISGGIASKGKIWSEQVFYVINLDFRQSRRANDCAGIVKRATKRLGNSELLKKAQQETNKNAAIIK